jgi:hypothetical protein
MGQRAYRGGPRVWSHGWWSQPPVGGQGLRGTVSGGSGAGEEGDWLWGGERQWFISAVGGLQIPEENL